ncbi:peptide-methionine (S)-S-oxide reductase MsrA [Caldibacillus thermolactis]|jgi:methionine-S-sulfoxide reductase|uniref:Peptide methionine sulfoxide reductase MsrA n=1 Tax=Pallidibacillus thermolactis TaxID=251051 RepID=A0ABT2WIV2_9BACI|nr:peptide-methionine (S)-S-oxide reductase MsrA [Pallidibacillus thermolactis]MCU9595613.1 peptide-methionine (S)-S-oxide reductase MsrA [Pallidibacillus thermolactis]MCU9602576.1 peptide-methionine (S)-S-oxide reductase MsrA [Pallidibacillus thermolactis subsp. kokeshiiformis]MED1674500.1 peptide-methionine (S)-S-oxide reductase MsrA [Pallidibacillus thermolactis subsp. kokeshiiformis]
MSDLEKATFAGGCFWCMVKPFDQWEGVESVISGYSGGNIENPTYEQVKSGTTGHYEVVQITYDPTKLSYETILNIYWQQIDPTDPDGQFHDRGSQYRTAIFYHTEEQRILAEKSKSELEKSGKFNRPIVTKILPAQPFYPAEEYHQDFYKKAPEKYLEDRKKSGRDEFISKHWESV